MTKRQIYTMCEARTRNGAMKDHPLPVLKINGNLRFRKPDVDAWLLRLTSAPKKQRAPDFSSPKETIRDPASNLASEV
jgi:hypothetical protein